MRVLVLLLVLIPFVADAASVNAEALPVIEVLAVGKQRLLLKIDQTVSGERGWRQHVEILVPRGYSVVLPTRIIRYRSAIEFNNGDSSYLRFPPRYGFVLFGGSSEGPTVEVRLVELFDKRDYVASSINGVYRFSYPDSSK